MQFSFRNHKLETPLPEVNRTICFT